MGTSNHKLSQVNTDAEFNRHLLLQEIDRLLAVMGHSVLAHPSVVELDSGRFTCRDCACGEVSSQPLFVTSPIYCFYCGHKLAYRMLREDAAKTINWIASLVQRDIRVPHPNWKDLKLTATELPAEDPLWSTVEYIIYAGSSIDPDLRCE